MSTSRYGLKKGWDNEVAEATAIRNTEERRAAAEANYSVEFLGFPEPGGRLADKTHLPGVYESQLNEDDYRSVADHWECRGRAELVWRPERRP